MAAEKTGVQEPGPKPEQRAGQVPLRPFGRSGVKVSALGVGGHHLGSAPDLATATRIVDEALEAGINFFDNCWEYHNGKSEDWLGRALAGKRQRAFLMTKVCTHGRAGALALRMLDESLHRLQTDHLDLWQIHGVSFGNDPERAFAKGGVIEAMEQVRRQGKVRFLGFSGHKDPAIHLQMLAHGFAFDAVQMPLNCLDASFRSFEKQVLPELLRRGIAPLGMKSLNGHGDAVKKGVVSAQEALRYAMSLPVATTISGIDSLEVLRQNLGVARDFQPLAEAAMQVLRQRCAPHASDGRYELYKVSLKFDNPEARRAHDFPIDEQQMEVKEMLKEATGGSPPW